MRNVPLSKLSRYGGLTVHIDTRGYDRLLDCTMLKSVKSVGKALVALTSGYEPLTSVFLMTTEHMFPHGQEKPGGETQGEVQAQVTKKHGPQVR